MTKLVVCLFMLRLNIPVNNFSVMLGWSHHFLGLYYQYFRRIKCLAQGHNMAEIGLEPRPLAPESDALPLSHHAFQLN